MPDIQMIFKEAWSNALSGVNAGVTAAEQEAEKILGKIGDAAGFTPEDVRRHAREFGERLVAQRKEIERSIDEGVRRAANRFRIPTRDDIETLQKRLDAVSARVDALAANKDSGEA